MTREDPPSLSQGQLDACTNNSTVGLHTDQMESDPVILRMPGILEEQIVILITRNASTDLQKNVFISVIIDVSKSDPHALFWRCSLPEDAVISTKYFPS